MSDKQNTLEDIVPPLELCKAARELIGDRTALVYKQVPYKYKDGIVVKKKWIICKRFDGREPQIPAPTLAELLEMLPGGTEIESVRDQQGSLVSYRVEIKGYYRDDPCGFEYDKANPATAALRLLMRVKGVGK